MKTGNCWVVDELYRLYHDLLVEPYSLLSNPESLKALNPELPALNLRAKPECR